MAEYVDDSRFQGFRRLVKICTNGVKWRWGDHILKLMINRTDILPFGFSINCTTEQVPTDLSKFIIACPVCHNCAKKPE